MNDQDSFDNIDQLLFHLGKFTYSVLLQFITSVMLSWISISLLAVWLNVSHKPGS